MNHLFSKTKKRLQLSKHSVAKLSMSQNQLQMIEGGKRALQFSTIGGEPRCTSISTASQQDCLVLELQPFNL
jgi:hypothetical protein